MEKSKKNAIILSVVAIATFAILVIGATYAYFQAQTGTSKSTDVKVTTYTTDVFTFTTGDDISIYADQSTFASGKGNQTGSTYASALLTANNKTNTATEHYYLYLNIENNTFTYSINESTPEIIMTVTDSSGNEVTDISTLNHVIVTGANNTQVSGYDITNKNGLITLFNNREITTTSSKEEKWNITITFVNYDASQNGNAGKSMSAKVMIQKEMIPQVVSDICSGGENLATCITTLANKSTSSLTNIYHHDANLTNGAGDNSYRYSGPSGEGVCTFDSQIVQGAYSNGTFGASHADDCANVYYLTSGNNKDYLDNSVTRLLSNEKAVTWKDGACKTTDGEIVNIVFNHGKFDQVTKETCKDNSYIVTLDDTTMRVGNLNITYSGVGTWKSTPNNFVCFGTNVTPCPTDNLYRIIGVFDNKVGENQTEQRVKLIKSTSVGDKAWDSNNENTWSTSSLNTYLNNDFLNAFDETTKGNIAETTWKVGGNTFANIAGATPSVAYQNEVVNPVPGSTSSNGETESSAKVGLMYASDYGFAAAPSAWTPDLFDYDGEAIKNVNWMYIGATEWTISRRADDSKLAFGVDRSGGVDFDGVVSRFGVRPSFNLSSSVNYASGSGTAADPIVVN